MSTKLQPPDFSRLSAGLGLTVLLASCAVAPELPIATKTTTTCLYKALVSAPEVSNVTVLVEPPYGPLISYRVHTESGVTATTEISVDGPDSQGEFRYSGAIGAGNNPIDGMKDLLARDCHAYPRFTDQVFLTDHARKVDMSKYSDSPTK